MSVCGIGAGASSTAGGASTGAGSDFLALALGCLDSLDASDNEEICRGSIFPYKKNLKLLDITEGIHLYNRSTDSCMDESGLRIKDRKEK